MQILNKSNFDTTIKGDKPVIIDFFAVWCPPCKKLAPVFEGASKKRSDVVFAKVDIDESPDIAAAYGVANVPTLISFKNGEQNKRIVGFVNEDEILDLL